MFELAVGLRETMPELLPQLLEYTLATYFPRLHEQAETTAQQAKLLYEQVVTETAKLAAHWQCIGFTHGVLNTDNMSIHGLTIDYGPFGFVEQ